MKKIHGAALAAAGVTLLALRPAVVAMAVAVVREGGVMARRHRHPLRRQVRVRVPAAVLWPAPMSPPISSRYGDGRAAQRRQPDQRMGHRLPSDRPRLGRRQRHLEIDPL
ncbi:MAG: hypothetical protein WDN06_07090 [Asticcacaulis sp.]